MAAPLSSYDPQSFETRWYAHWEASGCFKPRGTGTPYSILLPPPNVTGTLHMGHAFQHTLQDALIRYHRMRVAPDGTRYDTLWQMGTDHAGIATEMVVGRNLAAEGHGETRDSLGRDAFIEKVWEWKQESGDTIARQMRRLGASGDWSREVFTMDPMPSQAVIEAFVRLYENKDKNGNPDPLIYRGQRLVNWDPVLKTAISDLEVVSEEEDGFLWSIRYDVIDPQPGEPDHLVVATTRPETMLGDVAVAVHPDDERYATLVSNKRRLRLPLTEREIPIIADDYVDREFGTGAVKITPAHDFNDYQVWKRHVPSGIFAGLPDDGLLNIFTPSARILHDEKDGPDSEADLSSVPIDEVALRLSASEIRALIAKKYWGLDRYDARKVVLSDLEAEGLLIETKKHKLQVPRGDRTGQVIEPYLTDQWFVKMDTLGARGLELAQSGAVKFVPPNWINTYRHWMGNIQDWCISRQLWWGHRIPAWYDDTGRIYVGHDEAEVRVKHHLADNVVLHQDNDVLETWFSSALWPFSTMGWPDENAMAERGFDRYLPSSVLVTGFDIIFFWVARMIMMTDHFTGQVPFREVYITGLVRDSHGQKMSKSKGNVLDPIDLIDGIALDDLVAKRTTGLMQPQMAARIEKATRKEFPDGIPAFGADALRFTLAALATHGRDIKFDLGRCGGYKNFCNKLWNAARFVLMNTEGFAAPVGAASGRDRAGDGAPTSSRPEAAPTSSPQTDAEHWILHEFMHTLRRVEEYYADYRFDLVSEALYDFTWNQYCDWFLELAKPALQADDAAAASTRHTLLFVLESLLRALHPLIPFVTEEIWQHVAPKLGIAAGSISMQSYPAHTSIVADAATAARVEILKGAVIQIRSIRSQMNIPPSKLVPLLIKGPTDDSVLLQLCGQEESLKSLTRLESVVLIAGAEPPPSSMAPYCGLELHIPLVDPDAERARLAKEIARVETEIRKCEGKLASATFVQNAPVVVVDQERARLIDWTTQRDALRAQEQRLADA